MSVRSGVAPIRGRRGDVEIEPPKKARPLAALVDVAKLIGRSDAPQLKIRLVAALALTAGGKALGVLAPLLLGAAVNRLVAGKGAGVAVGYSFAALAIGWAVIRFASAAAPQVRDMVFNKVAQAAWRRAAADTFAHALSLSIDYHQSKRTGALARTVDRGARAVDYLLRLLAFNLAPTVLELILAAGVLGKAYDWRFAAIAVVTVLIYAVVTFSISNWRVDIRRAMNEADSEASGRAVDALLNYETVKAFGAEVRAAGGYEDALVTYGKASIRANNSLAILNIIQAAIMSFGLGVMAVVAGLEAAAGRMGPGDVTASVLILTSLYQPLAFLGFAYREVRQSFIDMEAMAALMQETSGIGDAPHAVDLVQIDPRGGEVVFDAVSYQHDARSQGLEEVSFRAQPGTTVAFVGPSGAGKTTMARLALRLIDPQSGRVIIDGVDLRQAKQASVRRATALVPQDVALFNTSLKLNLNFARPGATDEEIMAAAEAAELGAFIRSLPEGLETPVGERGLKLSGGERQRVGIARALLADPRVLVLDEATSALDSRTEQAIQATLRKARVGRTTLVVAHRLSTIADADQILVLKAGKIVERGDHATLLALNGEYAALWRKQIRED